MKSREVSQQKRLVVATIFTFVFMSGFALASCVLGTLLPGIIEHYHLNITEASSINIFNEIGNTSAMIFALFVLDRMDKGKALAVFALFYGIMLFVFGTAPAFTVLLIVRMVVGFIGGLLDNMCATYISDLYGEHRARYVSILHTLYAIGSMIAPKFAALCYSVGGWPLAYLVSGITIAIAGALCIVIFKIIRAPIPAVGVIDRKEKVHIPYKAMLKSRNMIWLCVSGLVFAGVTYVTLWLSTYLYWVDSSVYTVGFCSTIMTASYVGMLISRTMLAAISEKVSTAVYLKWASLLSGLLLIVLLIIQNPYVWLAGAFLFGVIGGATYTARFVLSCQEFPEYSATASGFTGIFNALGSILFSRIVGMAADAGYYTQAMMGIAVVILLGFIIFSFCYREPSRHQE